MPSRYTSAQLRVHPEPAVPLHRQDLPDFVQPLRPDIDNPVSRGSGAQIEQRKTEGVERRRTADSGFAVLICRHHITGVLDSPGPGAASASAPPSTARAPRRRPTPTPGHHHRPALGTTPESVGRNTLRNQRVHRRFRLRAADPNRARRYRTRRTRTRRRDAPFDRRRPVRRRGTRTTCCAPAPSPGRARKCRRRW